MMPQNTWHHEHSCGVYKSLFYHVTQYKIKENRIQHSFVNTESVHLCYNLQKCFLFDTSLIDFEDKRKC